MDNMGQVYEDDFIFREENSNVKYKAGKQRVN